MTRAIVRRQSRKSRRFGLIEKFGAGSKTLAVSGRYRQHQDGVGMKLRTSGAVALMFVVAWTACGTETQTLPGGGSSSGRAGEDGSAATGGTSAAGNAGISGIGATGGGGTGATSTGGSGGASGSAGQPPIDASYPDVVFAYDAGPDPGTVTEDSACASVSETAQVERQPVDIIVIVDNSGSMTSEAGFVQQNLNGFSQQIISSGIDVHVVLISSYPGTGNGICISAPLGSGGCPTQDTRLPTFLHVNQEVGSTNGLQLLLSTYNQWQSVMRANAPKHLVMITDDDSSLDAASFDSQFKALNSSHNGYTFHAIYGFTKPDFLTCLVGGDSCCGQTANVGTVYRTLVAQTGGVEGNLCLQNFGPVFNVLASSVIAGTPIRCEFPMPTPTQGVVNPDDVTLQFALSPSAAGQTWTLVANSSVCTSTSFYYDQTPNPTKIVLCPGACTTAQQASNPTIRVLLGCLGS